MKFSNFREVTSPVVEFSYATIEVTTGRFFKTTKQVGIFKPASSNYWRYLDTGEYLQESIDNLYTAYKAQELFNENQTTK